MRLHSTTLLNKAYSPAVRAMRTQERGYSLGTSSISMDAALPTLRKTAGYRAQKHKTHKIGLIPGDGNGAEIVTAAQKVLQNLDVDVDFVTLEAGFSTFQKTKTSLPENTLARLRECDGILFGCVNSPKTKVTGYFSPIVALRKELDLYANVRPLVSVPMKRSLPGTRQEVNAVVVRENTECISSSQERLSGDGQVAYSERSISKAATRRIAKLAFTLAEQRRAVATEEAELQSRLGAFGVQPREASVTAVHKASLLPVSDGLFLQSVNEIAQDHPNVKYQDELVDTMAYNLIKYPQKFDVIVAPSMYGDILQDVGAAIVGNLDVIPTANVGDKTILTHASNIVHSDNVAPGRANPLGTIRAAAMILQYLGQTRASEALERAVETVLCHGPFLPEQGGSATSEELVKAVISQAHYFEHLSQLSAGSA